MKKTLIFIVSTIVCLFLTFPANAATIGHIDVDKIFSNYEKTKKVQKDIRDKAQMIQDEVTRRQKEFEEEKIKGRSESDLKNLAEKYEKELEPKSTELARYEKKMAQEIKSDIVKATESVAKKMGIDIVLDKKVFISGGTDITDEVIKLLNKK